MLPYHLKHWRRRREPEMHFFFFLLIPWIVFRCYLRYIRCIREVSHGVTCVHVPVNGTQERAVQDLLCLVDLYLVYLI